MFNFVVQCCRNFIYFFASGSFLEQANLGTGVVFHSGASAGHLPTRLLKTLFI